MSHQRMPLTELSAQALADILGGVHWQPYPGIWLVVIQRNDESLIVIDDDAIREYENESMLECASPLSTIDLPTLNPYVLKPESAAEN